MNRSFCTVSGENCAGLDELIRKIRTGEVPISALGNERLRQEPGGARVSIAPWGQLTYDNQRAIGLEWYNEAVAIAERPVAEQPAGWRAWEAQIKHVRAFWHTPLTANLPAELMPVLSANRAAYYRRQADIGATVILLAAERHRIRTGSWPGSVEEIEGSILPDPPLDPFTGDDYRMEHRDGRLLVYSVGPNLRDEHGDYNVRKWGTKATDQDDVGAIGWDVALRGLVPVSEDEENEAGDRPRP